MAKKSEEEYLSKLSKRIKDLRIDRGYTNYENFAYENGISRAQYGRYENGEDMRASTLFRIIRIFGLTPKQFFEEGFDDKLPGLKD